MTHLSLAVIGWVDEPPRGNRLRWHIPLGTPPIGPGSFLFPDKVIVERAPLSRDQLARGDVLGWRDGRDETMAGFPVTYIFPARVQAARFRWQGPDTVMRVRDSAMGADVLVREVSGGETVEVQAPFFDTLLFISFWGTVDQVRFLDAYKAPGLDWEPIAEILVAGSRSLPYAEAMLRFQGMPTMTPDEWNDLCGLASEVETDPLAETDGSPPVWQTLLFALSLRWEHAVLFGHGFLDGPLAQTCPADDVATGRLLTTPSGFGWAYRILDPDGRFESSNIAYCRSTIVAPLGSPFTPVYADRTVELGDDEMTFRARAAVTWQQTDEHALGVEIEEDVRASPSAGSPGTHEVYEVRSRRPDDPPMYGSLARVFDVASYDVEVRARARAVDGWDRASPPSAWSPFQPLTLVHVAQPPPLAAARIEGSSIVDVQAPDTTYSGWAPDIVVARAGGKVGIWRRLAPPRTATGTAGLPYFVAGNDYAVNISGVSGLGDFLNGTLSAGAVSATITAISGSQLHFSVFDNGSGPVSLFPPGPVRLTQDPKADALWTPVAEFPAVGLPASLDFADALPPVPASGDTITYRARIHYLGRYGPFGNAVTAFRLPPVLVVPPPFHVDRLGIDFYNRTLLKITFTDPVTDGTYSIAWAAGTPSLANFARLAMPAEAAPQAPYGSRYLYAVAAMPIPLNQAMTVTVGVQRIDDAGSQSDFVLVAQTLEPAAP